MKTLIKAWKSRGGKWFLKLYVEDFQGRPSYSYEGRQQAGNLGWISEEDAVRKMQHCVDSYALDGITLKEAV